MRDEQLLQAITEELDWEPRVDATNLVISVDNGVVTLSGTVRTYFEKLAAEGAVRRTKGAQTIVQEIEVHVPEEEVISDDMIAKRLRDLLAWDPMIPEHLIEVSVDKGWVTLTGQVHYQYQRVKSDNYAHNLLGVTGVTDRIEVVPAAAALEAKERIEDALKRNADPDIRKIKVSVQDAKVTLEGTVRTWWQHDLIGDIACLAPGVRAIDNQVQVIPQG